ncbi:hypothetical protein CMO94_02010 [Candidatus Woesearchaeota archaeon]|jgi:hypothetical protein|nr:hypothetical protein [Candidatus Woesearchaeota archaeon]|tara:strand:+ start:1964 stop:2320 length:357 start_codon:yes stop_codon:yes gene_type:complete
MIELFTLLISILFAIFLIFTLFAKISLLINLVILIALYFLIKKDLKDKDNHKYYLISLFLTAIFFILSTFGFVKDFLMLTEKMLLSVVIVSVIVLYIFAHVIAFVYEYYIHLKEKYKR